MLNEKVAKVPDLTGEPFPMAGKWENGDVFRNCLWKMGTFFATACGQWLYVIIVPVRPSPTWLAGRAAASGAGPAPAPSARGSRHRRLPNRPDVLRPPAGPR